MQGKPYIGSFFFTEDITCSRCYKWLMESYMNKLTRSDSGGFHTVEP